jgi:hypothetical protein
MSQLTEIPPGYVLTHYEDGQPVYAKPSKRPALPTRMPQDVSEPQKGVLTATTPGNRPKPTRIRQSSKPTLNKLEARCLAQVLKPMYPGLRIAEQAWRVKIAGSAWYKVDFFVPALMEAHEVKGPRVMKNFASRQMLALKVAATTWPEIKWFLHWHENGQWQRQIVLP